MNFKVSYCKWNMNWKFGLSRHWMRPAKRRSAPATRLARMHPFAALSGGAGGWLAACAPGGLCRGRFTQPAPAPGPVLLCRRYGNDWTAVRVSVPEYTPACCAAGMASSRLALRLLVPVPEPACADARVAAVVPRPGAPGATVAPSVTPVPRAVSVGVHPSWLPEMVKPVAVVLPAKSDSWPVTDQPGVVLRVSDTVIAFPFRLPVPVVLAASTVRVTAFVFAVKVNTPVAPTVKVTGMGNGPLDPTTVNDALPVEPLKPVLVGVNTADTGTTVPAVAGAVVVVVATPVALTATGVPMLVPPAENCTDPAGMVVPEAGVTVAVRVTVAPGAGVVDERASAVLVPTTTGPVALVV